MYATIENEVRVLVAAAATPAAPEPHAATRGGIT
jgi:hypothetical protein